MSKMRWMTLLAGVAVAVYTLMWVGYRQRWGWLDTFDAVPLRAFHDYGIRHPGWVSGWDIFCTVLGPNAFRLIGLVVVIIAVARRRLWTAAFLVVGIGLSGPVSVLAKNIANRPRPSTALVEAPSSSFPSGHAVGVMVGVLVLLTVLLPGLRGPSRAAATWIGIWIGAVVVLAIGVGRVVLNVHHPSDVLAGWALGYFYYFLCVVLLRRLGQWAKDRQRPVLGAEVRG